MSQIERDRIEWGFKGVMLVLLSLCSFFLVKTSNQVDKAYESTIRLEERVQNLEREILNDIPYPTKSR